MVDAYVGQQLRKQRTLLGYSQQTLGDKVALTFQQIQKYERGANRIGASRLYQFAQVLNVPIDYFFQEIPDDMADKITTRNEDGEFKIWEEDQAAYDAEPLITKRETLELVRAYYNIPSPQLRKKFFELCKSLSADTVVATATDSADTTE
ncbi:MAG: helix-turn-helix domain-containing protein [Alphaproteobacteria bacterium]|nr:helix-turn-helix domain-containing protein [Alphaproteobacteria bacterium]